MKFSTQILSWYNENKRDLPWRKKITPYKTWLSEIILQQTRVSQGLPYYNEFIRKYPSIEDFHDATEQEILSTWQGLGYYSRARNMKVAAAQIMTDWKGEFPKDFKKLKSLKGVGEYTAAAIASICFNETVPVVDGNVYRVLSRYLNIQTPIDSTQGKREFLKAASELMSTEEPGDYNQGLMEIGAMVCTPKSPQCASCPLNIGCLAFANGNQLELPVKIKKIKKTNRYLNFIMIDHKDYYWIEKRTDKDIWKSLYTFPLVEGDLMDFTSLIIKPKDHNVKKLCSFKHLLTHQTLFNTFYKLNYAEVKNEWKDKFVRIQKNQIDSYPIPKVMEKYFEIVG